MAPAKFGMVSLDRLLVISSLGLASPRDIIRVLGETVGFMLVLEGIGAPTLWIHWWLSGIVPACAALFHGIFHSVAAFCYAGFDLFGGLPQYPQGLPADPITLITFGLLVIIGGLGIPVYMEFLFRRDARKRAGHPTRLSLQTRITLWSAAVLILVGWAGLLISEYRHVGVLAGTSFGERMLRAWFQSVSARTAGFACLNDFSDLHQASSLLLIYLMFIGSAPASMGGGITTGTFSVSFIAMWSLARDHCADRQPRRGYYRHLATADHPKPGVKPGVV